MRWLVERLTVWVLIGTLLVAGGLVALGVALFYLIPPQSVEPPPAAMLTRIPGPTPTSTPLPVTPTPTPTQPVVIDGISIGKYVQITGTAGQGLRLRDGPGTTFALRFLGMDAEVFLVKEGPGEADGFTWWFLEAPYDPNRSGWAASQYLTVVNQPGQP